MFRMCEAAKRPYYTMMCDGYGKSRLHGVHEVCIPFGAQSYTSRSIGACIDADEESHAFGEHVNGDDLILSTRSFIFSDHWFHSHTFNLSE